MDFDLKSSFNDEKNRWEISLTGEIDIYNSSAFKLKVGELLQEKCADVEIDCTSLEYIDSTGLGALVSILKMVKQEGHNVSLSNVKPSVHKLFKITDLDKVFMIGEVE